MTHRYLFVAAEIGAARYLLPLWRRWLAGGRPEFRVVVSRAVGTYLRDQRLAIGLPIVGEYPTEADAIEIDYGDYLVGSAGDRHPLERAALRWSLNRGAFSAQIIDTWFNYRHRFDYPDDGVHYPDRILVVDDIAIHEATAEGLPRNRLVAIGQPSWELATQLPPPPKRRTLFLSGPVRRQYGDRLGYDEFSTWALLKETAARHPALVGDIWYGRHPVQTDITTEMVAPARLLSESMAALAEVENVVGSFSSPMIDALIGGRRVVSLQPGAKGLDMCPLSRHGRIRRAGTTSELRDALEEDPRGGEELVALLRGSLDRLDRFLQETWA